MFSDVVDLKTNWTKFPHGLVINLSKLSEICKHVINLESPDFFICYIKGYKGVGGGTLTAYWLKSNRGSHTCGN